MCRMHLPTSSALIAAAVKVVTWLTMPLEPGSDNPSLQIANMQARAPQSTTAAVSQQSLMLHCRGTMCLMQAGHSVQRSASHSEVLLQAVKEAALAQDVLKVIVDLVAEPLARHPRMTDKVCFSCKSNLSTCI